MGTMMWVSTKSSSNKGIGESRGLLRFRAGCHRVEEKQPWKENPKDAFPMELEWLCACVFVITCVYIIERAGEEGERERENRPWHTQLFRCLELCASLNKKNYCLVKVVLY